ncbi:hypothetical protein ACS5PJ_14350 [Pseudarthrobacter sp. YS3]|uniref:hypothetical protein n=1 Tax=Pseudarthrobacter sp. YS3 TaxID=3453718 RepID=UPI003EEC0C8D
MTWFKMDDGFANSKPVLRIPRRYRLQAVGLWALAGTWSAKEETDGFIPEYVLEELCGTAGVANQLVQAGLWETVSGSSEHPTSILSTSSSDPQLPGWVYRNWSKYQPTKAELEENREKERIRKANYRMSQRDTKGTGSGQTEGHHPESEHPDPTRPDPTIKEEAKASSAQTREDVDHLCTLLADMVEGNGSKRPEISTTWTDEARRLLDLDGREFAKAENLIRWSQRDTFWRKNILSMTKFRAKYDQLRLAAMEDWEKNKTTASPDGEIDVDAILGRDVWSTGTPPEGLDYHGEIEWKKARRAAHQAERLAEAKVKLGLAS